MSNVQLHKFTSSQVILIIININTILNITFNQYSTTMITISYYVLDLVL